MTKDLEDTLNELGPEYRSLINRLRAPFSDSAPRVRRSAPRTQPYLLAASLLLVLGLAIWNLPSIIPNSSFYAPNSSRAPRVYTAAYAADEFALRLILDSQRGDGSWSNDYLTMQNAAALRKAADDASRIAYKRAVRYLRSKGLGPISDEEFRQRAERLSQGGGLPKSDGNLI